MDADQVIALINSAFAGVAVPLAAIVGAISCLAFEHMFEATLKAIIAGSLVSLALPTIPKFLAKDPALWALALIGLLIGFLSGIAIGSLLGGICRLLYKPAIGHSGPSDGDRPPS